MVLVNFLSVCKNDNQMQRTLNLKQWSNTVFRIPEISACHQQFIGSFDCNFGGSKLYVARLMTLE